MARSDLRETETPAMRAALDMARAEQRPPTEADAPPPSTFPPTPASRAALRLARKSPGYKARRNGTGRAPAA